MPSKLGAMNRLKFALIYNYFRFEVVKRKIAFNGNGRSFVLVAAIIAPIANQFKSGLVKIPYSQKNETGRSHERPAPPETRIVWLCYKLARYAQFLLPYLLASPYAKPMQNHLLLYSVVDLWTQNAPSTRQIVLAPAAALCDNVGTTLHAQAFCHNALDNWFWGIFSSLCQSGLMVPHLVGLIKWCLAK